MDSREFPSHLRPVPDSGDSTAPALEPDAGTPGLTPPVARGRSSGFVTDVLVDLGYVIDDVARQAIENARTAGRPPERLLVEQGAITADQLSRAVAERYGLDHVDLSAYQVDMAAANLISVNTARRYKALPVGFVDKETLLVAMADPTNVLAVDDIQTATALDCRVAVAAGEDIEALICRPSVARGRRSASSTRRTRSARSMSWGWTGTGASASRRPSTRPTARCWSPARPARASRRPSTPRCRRSTTSSATSSRSRIRSSTGWRESTRSTSTARPGSTSPPACARSCAPTPTS